MFTRRSNIAYVAVRLRLSDGSDALLLRAHEKWGDFSLLGGHVESDEQDDWSRTALRETEEEMEPLTAESDFEITRLPICRSEWGPVASRSAGGQSTLYEAEWFSLRFLRPPERVLRSVEAKNFSFITFDTIDGVDSGRLASIVLRLRESLEGGLAALPLAWPNAVDMDSVGIERLDDLHSA